MKSAIKIFSAGDYEYGLNKRNHNEVTFFGYMEEVRRVACEKFDWWVNETNPQILSIRLDPVWNSALHAPRHYNIEVLYDTEVYAKA
jgi:hypothetical protein